MSNLVFYSSLCVLFSIIVFLLIFGIIELHYLFKQKKLALVHNDIYVIEMKKYNLDRRQVYHKTYSIGDVIDIKEPSGIYNVALHYKGEYCYGS